ncbi:MAG: hypothetical protein HQL86_00385 [Magnetococcales bacterium]|nr:hypothetical protein [Magnetococcales bacterium]
MLDENNSQLKLFVEESRNRVQLCLDDFDTLAQSGPEIRAAAFERLLRTTRGIGGSARFHALTQVVRLCQSLESFLGRFRAHLLNARPEFISVVVLAMKKLSQLLDNPLLTPPLSIDPEILAIQSMLAAHADPPEFNLADYPQALAMAVRQGLDFYSIHMPLGGAPEANRQQFLQIKTAVEAVATLVAAKPDLGSRFEWRDDLPGGMVRLLLSTVLPGEILHGLIQLPQEQIVRLEIPEALSQAVNAEIERQARAEAEERTRLAAPVEEDALAETQLGEVEEQVRLSEAGANSHTDPLEDTQLGEAEARARQAHIEEMRRQEALQEEQRRKAAYDAAERERLEQARRQDEERQRQEAAAQAEARNRQAAQRAQRRRWIYGGLAAAGVLVVVAHQTGIVSLPGEENRLSSTIQISKELRSQSAPNTNESATVKPAPVIAPPPASKPAVVSAAGQSSAAPPPVVKPPEPTLPKEPPAAAPPVVKPPEPALLKETPAVPPSASTESRQGEPTPFSPLMKEQNNLPDVDVKAEEQASRSAAPPLPVKPELPAEPTSWQSAFARHDTPMVRLTKESYESFKPAKNTKHGSMRVRRTPDGDLLFSIADMMGHTAMRQKERFQLTPESMTELRLVFQVERGHAYMFALDRDGETVIPKEFWSEFSKVSKKAVSVSRVMKESPEGVHLKDLTALTMSYILRTTAP